MADVNGILEQVRKTKEIMLGNMDAMIARGDKLEALKDKTATLEDKARLFADAAHELQERAKSRYMAVTFILIGVSIGAIYTIVSGFSMPVVLTGSLVGGAVGYAVNFVRNWFVDTFFPKSIDNKPTANVEDGDKNGHGDDLEFALGQDASYLNAFTMEPGTSVKSSLVKSALKSKLRV